MPPALPKLSYVLLSHNRVKYIRAAIESAFAQDYEGELEYIFSDDCSTDRTFEIIKECVAAYKGKRRVVVTQTPRNLHLAGNTNHAVQFVESDWIVRADDDDISTPDRCSIIGRAIANHPGCSYVYTLMQTFVDGEKLNIKPQTASSDARVERLDVLNGHNDMWTEFFAADTLHQVWSCRHFKQFGPLPENGYWVDDVISNMRCCCMGFGIKIYRTTAYIRNNSGNMSKGGADGSRGYKSIIQLENFNDNYYNTTLPPLLDCCDSIQMFLRESGIQAESFISCIKKDIAERKLLCSFWRKGTINRIRVSRAIGAKGLFSMIRCLPLPIYAALLTTYRKLVGKA